MKVDAKRAASRSSVWGPAKTFLKKEHSQERPTQAKADAKTERAGQSSRVGDERVCYTCKKKGHIARDCKSKTTINQVTVASETRAVTTGPVTMGVRTIELYDPWSRGVVQGQQVRIMRGIGKKS